MSSGRVSGLQIKLIPHIWFVVGVSRNFENLPSSQGNIPLYFATIADFPYFHFLPNIFCLSLLTINLSVDVPMLVLIFIINY